MLLNSASVWNTPWLDGRPPDSEQDTRPREVPAQQRLGLRHCFEIGPKSCGWRLDSGSEQLRQRLPALLADYVWRRRSQCPGHHRAAW